MIFGAVNCAAHVEIVEAKHNRIRANALYVGSRIGNPVLQPSIEQVEMRTDIAHKLPIARHGQAIGTNAKGRVIFDCGAVVIASKIQV